MIDWALTFTRDLALNDFRFLLYSFDGFGLIQMDFLLKRDHKELDGILRDLLLALDAGGVEESFKQLDLFWARFANAAPVTCIVLPS